MNNFKHRRPIPWFHRTNPLVTSWIWDTDHFTVTIYAEGTNARKMYHWKINDKSSGTPVPFDSSAGDSFADCVDTVLEIIGKSYKRTFGYQEYAGDLATTFKVHDGRVIDLSSLIGENVSLVARDDSSSEPMLITGMFDIQHYDVVIRTGETSVSTITPSFIIDIQKEFGTMSALDELESGVKASKNKTIFYEEWRRGCTGRAGFNAGTVEHNANDAYCPIHGV